jgi:hypothetical protein
VADLNGREKRRTLERRVENAKTLGGRVQQTRRELERGKDWMYREMRRRYGSL